MAKKILGWFLIIIAALLTLGTLGTLGSVLKSLVIFVSGIVGKQTAYNTARAFGALIAQTIILVIIYFSWIYGRKWTRKKERSMESNNQQL